MGGRDGQGIDFMRNVGAPPNKAKNTQQIVSKCNKPATHCQLALCGGFAFTGVFSRRVLRYFSNLCIAHPVILRKYVKQESPLC